MTENDIALIATPETSRISGISRTEIWRQVKAKKFPQPVRLGPRCTRFSLEEVRAWVLARLAERDTRKQSA